jgi:hypothetical protein
VALFASAVPFFGLWVRQVWNACAAAQPARAIRFTVLLMDASRNGRTALRSKEAPMSRLNTRAALTALALSVAAFSFGSVAATQSAFAGAKEFQNAPHPQKPGPGLGPKNFQNAPHKPGPHPGPKPGPKFGGGSHGHGHGHGGHWGGMAAGLVGGAVIGAMATQAYAPADCDLETRAFQDGFGNLFYRQVQVCEE